MNLGPWPKWTRILVLALDSDGSIENIPGGYSYCISMQVDVGEVALN